MDSLKFSLDSLRAVRPALAGLGVAAAFGLALTGCGSSSGSSPAVVDDPDPVAQEGDILIAITDAEGDFVRYGVDVVSLTLERANGDRVETLPLSTRIDFTELTEVTEFLTIATVPAGNYEAAILTLDYQGAEIVVQDENGDELMATAFDEKGQELTVFDLRLNLTTSDVIRVAPGVPAAFSVDFDLDASNTIDLSTSPPQVTVEPFLLATPELETDREHRVRGALAGVDEAAAEITLRVRPSRHRNGDFGRFTLQVNDDTQYEVDGEGYTGADGLAAVAALPVNAPVVANGSISGRSMMADVVVAGSSVPWTDGDVVKGVVAARSGDELTVRGTRVEYRDGVEIFRGEGTVILGAGTTVTAPGVDNADLSIDSVSVGQRIVAFGELVDDRTIDATDGRVAMRMNQLTAAVVTPQPLAVDLYYLNGRRPDVFDFAGTGIDPSLDADPDNYEIDSGALDTSVFEAGKLIRVRGLVNDFGAAPDDFVARTIIDVATEDRPGSLTIGWSEGTQMPFFDLTTTQIDVDLSTARSFLKVRGVPRDITNPLQSAMLAAPADDSGLYAVHVRGSGELHLYRSFAELTNELDEQLDAGASLHRITAHVAYNPDSTEFTTRRASFVFRAAGDE